MAQLAIAAVGALALGPIGLGLTTAGTGFMLGSLAYSLMAPGQKSYGPRLNDLKVTGTEYGSPIPWIAGSPRVAGQIIWASERRETATKEEQGKGGGPSYTSYTYDVDLLILLSENEISGVSRIWSNGELIYGGGAAKEGAWVDMRVYTGDEEQLPDPTYEAAVGLGNAPAYRGMGTVVIQGLQLGNGGSIPNLTFELDKADELTTLWQKSAPDLQLTEITPRSQLYLHARLYSSFASAWTRAGQQYQGKHYVELELSGDVRGWQIGAVNRDAWDGAYPDRDQNGIWCVSNINYFSAAPGIITDGVFAPVGAGTAIDSDWSGRFGIEIDNDAGAVRVYRVGVLLHTWSTAGIYLEPWISSYGGEGKLFRCEILRSPKDWQYAPSGVLPFRPKIDDSASLSTTPLNAVITDLLQRAGYAPADYSNDPAADRFIRALAVGSVSNTRSVLEALQQAYFFECSASDQIYLRQRSVDAVATIPFADLGMASGSGGDDEPLALTLGNDLELPAQLALSYPNMAGDYQAATEFSDRLLSGQQSTETIQTALGLLPAEAKGIVDGLLMDRVASLATASLKLPLKYARLEPGDVINVLNHDARTYRLRVQSKTDAMPIIELQCVLDDVGAIDSAAITDTGYVNTETVIQPAGTLFEALDIPILRDADDAPGYYVAVTPQRLADTDKWPGAVVAQAWDEVNYVQLLTTTAQCVMGSATTVLGNWQGGPVFDEASTVTVQVSGELASSTRAAMLLDDSINALLLGSEIVRFRSAALLAPGSYLLSGLLRGQRGTEWAMGSHAAGERCVLLGNGLRRAASQTNEIGLQRQIKAVTMGMFLSDGAPKDFADSGVALKPFSPANPRALAEGTDLLVTWQRRTRRSYQYAGAAPVVPLGEAAEAYRVRAYVGATLKRSDLITTATYRYTSDMRAADGVASGTAVQFEICQISATVGPGYPSNVGATAP